MKKILIVVGILVAMIGVIVGVVLFLTADLPKAADEFFTMVADGELESAYEITSEGFKTFTSVEAFEDFVYTYDLDLYMSSEWTGRSIESTNGVRLATLNGEITLSDGTVLPTYLEFTKNDGLWRISYIGFEF